jgi:hypothetical protein
MFTAQQKKGGEREIEGWRRRRRRGRRARKEERREKEGEMRGT